MLDRLRIDVAEVVKVSVIVIDVTYRREVQARHFILDDGEIREVRHESIYHCCKRVCVLMLGCICIQLHDLVIAGTCLEEEGRAVWAAGLDIDDESDVVEHFPIVLPYRLHTHHTDFFRVGEEDLDTLVPVFTLLQELRHSLKRNADSVSVIGCAV